MEQSTTKEPEDIECYSSDNSMTTPAPFETFFDELISTPQPETLQSTYKTIPQFYHKLPKNGENVPQKLREEARTLFLQKRSTELLDNTELKALWGLLEKNFTPPLVNAEQFISYDDYLNVIRIAGDKCKRYLTASVFAKLQSVSGFPGRVSIMSLFNYTMRKVWLQQTRIGLSLYDYTGQGYLRESDMESYIMELIPTLPQLEGLERSFHSFYVCTAVRKFFFFLDPLRTGKIRIRDILSCSFLDDLLELRDDESPKDSQELNWFSAPSALSVYGHYLNLDKDHNGMLSKSELSGYGSGTLTSVFLDRVFSECHTYDGEMDYKTYLDFVLCLENRQEPQSLHYLFRILDFEHKGYLTSFTLNYFFKGIQEQILAHRAEKVNFQDVKDEIFDMIGRPADPLRITLKDLINSGQGDTIVSILIEFHKFWAYENRETMVVESTNIDDNCASP
ncbi:serine/threonine-protein phosphatase 2A regulatory subunit B'' subunit gamma-like [Bradysia coprophila]|uniref:serine/threonine-protein phosphatase 2A regulatory subunit B'' subunit gamma-like n=1 Tax=Bradysia coprophila TaxID=38358 RepID=UPI00187D98F8|nr:serine/threonine-protein phosphatase 2A regulatory subunit B'' subunit gamma-like [Bradysia coprophila]XP_037049898.1 serine/threonine-protein phosphatase 2A regulatory subunit B'' subunit gamma-like [Bradysia coprophila]